MSRIFRKSSKPTALPSLCTHPPGPQPQLFCAGNHGFLPLSADHTGQRRLGGQQVRLLDGLSLSLSRLLQYSLHCRHHRPHCEVPPLLPHPSSLCLPHPQVLAPNSTPSLLGSPQFLGSFSRGFARALGGDQHSDPEPDGDVGDNGGETDSDPETDGDENVGGDFDEVNVNSGADPEEVSRVCRVIDELFALDRNMEAVLDECNVDLSHALVVGVLERFKHARKPAFRFFCWAGQKAGFTHNSRTYNAMMSVLGRTRQFETKERKKAVGVFELMKRYNFDAGVDTINCLLDNLGRAKLGKEAQALFEKLEDRFTPNLRTYTVLLNGWCRIKNLVEAGRTWNEMIDKGFKPDIIAHHTMLEGLLKCKKKSDAIKLFEVMKAKGPSPNVRTYTILIRDLCKQMKMKEAVEYFDEMVDSGCQPDAAVYTCLITGFGNQKKMDKVYALLKEMKEKGCPADGRTYNALIKLMTNRQMPDDAVRIYKKMIQNSIQPTLHTYNMMMKSYFYTRNYEMGCAVWEEMGRKGCCPDDNSYIVFIGGLIRHGRSEEACRYLEEMIEKGMKAPQLDYNKFAADFSRAGKPDILEELARKMKFEGSLKYPMSLQGGQR
ncbi:Pentatricopeptide repeat-containing protein, mitochondrial [Vitis vinifera]|uniref:Pentatricopeptide repeat-containing protein, mitochondrial n=1 Tax=Vitis vinifera TaxID=29760 RepID=A0A438J0H8_VITVI|nr:Pentatricopeptide repeat-containing protein, mitochondrial [Vitis vinifera]